MKINLLPRKKVKKRSPYLEQVVFAVALIGVILLVLIGGWWYLQKNIEALNKKIAITQKEIQRLKKDEEKIAQLKKDTNILEQKIKVIDQLEKSKSGPVKILSEIALGSIAERMWLTNLSCQGANLNLEGIAADNETIAQFMT
ncbi:MAG: PilN domain-containing protein, partial [Desulfobacterota bacterium]|nr:PilN domain-containing protein [Thermodesulfobacteriota bacterium]